MTRKEFSVVGLDPWAGTCEAGPLVGGLQSADGTDLMDTPWPDVAPGSVSIRA